MRQTSTLLEVAGLLALVAAGFSFNLTAGLLALGTALVVLGYFLED